MDEPTHVSGISGVIHTLDSTKKRTICGMKVENKNGTTYWANLAERNPFLCDRCKRGKMGAWRTFIVQYGNPNYPSSAIRYRVSSPVGLMDCLLRCRYRKVIQQIKQQIGPSCNLVLAQVKQHDNDGLEMAAQAAWDNWHELTQ